MSNAEQAAKMAGEWWAERVDVKYAGRRQAFAEAVSKRVLQEMNGEAVWDWWGEQHEGDGSPKRATTENDYGPHYCLIEALIEAIPGAPAHELRRALPRKHLLLVYPDRLRPKEGYGN
jgi:hypothetical protein